MYYIHPQYKAYKCNRHTLNQAHTHAHAHTHTNQRYVGKRWDFSAVLKDEADWENLIFFGSVFQRVGAKKEKEHSPYDLVLTDGMHSIRLSEEDQSFLEGV